MKAARRYLAWRRTPRAVLFGARTRALFVKFPRRNDGVAAVEFVLILPFLVFAFLAMIDTGLLVGEKISIDQLLRAGSEIAMTDPGADAVYDVIAAASDEYQVVPADQTPTADQLAVGVTRFYACLEDPSAIVAASAACAANNPTAAFYRATATKPFREILLPNLSVTSVFQVQVR